MSLMPYLSLFGSLCSQSTCMLGGERLAQNIANWSNFQCELQPEKSSKDNALILELNLFEPTVQHQKT